MGKPQNHSRTPRDHSKHVWKQRKNCGHMGRKYKSAWAQTANGHALEWSIGKAVVASVSRFSHGHTRRRCEDIYHFAFIFASKNSANVFWTSLRVSHAT